MKTSLTKLRIIFIILLPVALSACSTGSHVSRQHVSPFGHRFGWLDGKCLAIQNSNLEPGTRITIVTLSNAQHFLKGTIVKDNADSSSCGALLPGRKLANGAEYRFYKVAVEAPFSMAIGVVNASDDTTNIHDFSYTACTTSEGIQFTIWRGNPYASAQVWRGYEYIGYDVQGTCAGGHAKTTI